MFSSFVYASKTQSSAPIDEKFRNTIYNLLQR